MTELEYAHERLELAIKCMAIAEKEVHRARLEVIRCEDDAARTDSAERRHGIYTFPDGTMWDSGTNLSTRPDGSTFTGEPDLRPRSARVQADSSP